MQLYIHSDISAVYNQMLILKEIQRQPKAETCVVRHKDSLDSSRPRVTAIARAKTNQSDSIRGDILN